MFDPKFKVYVRGLELFGKLDSETINNLFGNLDEVIRVNDGLEDELNKLRDDRGRIFSKFYGNLRINCFELSFLRNF